MLTAYRYNAGKFPVVFSVFELTGSDVGQFLQNQSTYNFQELKSHEFHLASFLDPQGRVEFYCWALKAKTSVLLLTPAFLKSLAHARLERFLVSEDVEVLDRGTQEWTFVIGPKSQNLTNLMSYSGTLFEETAQLTQSTADCASVTPAEQELWRNLNGWPDFSGEHFSPELINNLRLYDLSVSPNKGCYPGQ